MSYHKLAHKPLNSSLNRLMKRAAHVGLGVGAFTPILVMANPTGSQVVAGQATIAAQNANKLVISQASNSAIINWQQFSIGQGQYVQFLQPSSSSVVLNRVVGGNASSILGTLNANGQVFLVNPNGIFFGKSASLDVQGIVASTLDIADSDFLSGNYVFDKGTGSDASVTNQGNIQARQGGYVVLAGDYAENDGIIQAKSGHIILASGTRTTLTLNGNNLVNFAVNDATLASFAGTKNTGSLIADGGTVIMTADVANALKATVVNNTGLIEAHAIGKTGGAIYLIAEGGNLTNAGTLDADATAQGRAGGDIVLKADGLTDLTSTSKITATGMGADGGYLEISGKSINVRGLATLGEGGNLLLDPGTMSIVSGNGAPTGSPGNNTSIGHIGVGFIQSQLNAKTAVTVEATNVIEASANVHAISATKAGGANLNLVVGNNGMIKLQGVTINIAGDLTASMGYGRFGFIQAKSVTLNDSHGSPGSIAFHKATTSAHGAVTKYSVLATGGDVDINGNQIRGFTSSGSGLLAIKAAGGNVNIAAELGSNNSALDGKVTLVGKSITDSKLITADGSIDLTASAGNLVLDRVLSGGAGITLNAVGHTLSFNQNNGIGPEALAGHGNLAINAGTIKYTGGANFYLYADGNLSIKGQLAFEAASQSQELTLQAGKSDTITLNKGFATLNGSVGIVAGHLAFTGGNDFTISAAHGNLNLSASIGSVNKPVAYNVTLKDKDFGIYIGKSIYVGDTAGGLAANITATEVGDSIAFNGVQVFDFNGEPQILQAAGNITFKGETIGLGNELGNAPSGGAITIKAGKNVTFSASGHGSGKGLVGIRPGKAVLTGSSSMSTAKTSTSILVQAGGNIKLVGAQVVIQAGTASADANIDTTHGGTANAGVTLKAGGNVTLTGGASNTGRVDIAAGSASARGGAFSSGTRTATANANVSITAKGSIAITGHEIEISGGFGSAKASAGEAGAAHPASMTATANATTTLTATTGNISLTAGKASGSSAIIRTQNRVDENGYARAGSGNSHAQATATVHADVSLHAGGAISVTANHIDIEAGSRAGFQGSSTARGSVAHAEGKSDVATDTITNNLSLTAGTGGITLTGGSYGGTNIQLDAEGVMLYGARALASGSGAKATATASGVLSLTTTGNVTMTGRDVLIARGYEVAAGALANASDAGSASIAGIDDLDITAAGALTIDGKQGVFLLGGGGAGHSAEAFALSGGKKALVKASANLNLQAASVKIAASSNDIYVYAGAGGAEAAHASASNGALASVDATSAISIKATHGALTLSAKDNVLIVGEAAAGGTMENSSTSRSRIHTTSANSFSSSVRRHSPGFDYTTADAKGAGAVATVSGNASVTLSATGALNVLQTNTTSGGVSLLAGAGAAEYANATAAYGGAATVSGTGAISLQAGAVTLKGAHVQIHGGSNAARGALSSVVFHHVFHHYSDGEGSSDGFGTTSTAPKINSADGAGAVAKLSADASVTIKGTTVSLIGDGGSVKILSGKDAGVLAQAGASDGGLTSISAKEGVSITATTAVSVLAQGGPGLLIEGGGASAFSAAVNATGAGAKALMNANGQVNITAPTVTLTAGGVHEAGIEIHGGGSNAGGGAVVHAGSDASAALTAKGGVNFTVANTFTAGLSGAGTGEIGMLGGVSTAHFARASADKAGGVATYSVDESVNITATKAGGTISILTNKRIGSMQLQAGGDAGVHLMADASQGGIASATVNTGFNLTAPGAITITASKGNILLNEFEGSAAASAAVTAKNGGKASLTVSDGLSMTGGTVSLKAGTFTTGTGTHARISGGLIVVEGAEHAHARSANVSASDAGVAGMMATDQVSLVATTGALTLSAGSELSVGTHMLGRAIGQSDSVTAAGGGAKASLTLDEGVLLQGATAVTFTAGTDLSVTTASGAGQSSRSGHGRADASAGFEGQATFTQNETVDIVTNGTFTAKAGDVLSLFAGFGNGGDAAKANQTGAKASFVDDGSLNITAGTVALAAGDSLTVAAGTLGAWDGRASAHSGGSATLTSIRDVNITAKNGVSMTLTGKGSGGEIHLGGFPGGDGHSDSAVGEGAQAFASGRGAKATTSDLADLNVTVTGATGAITLSAGSHTGALLALQSERLGFPSHRNTGSGSVTNDVQAIGNGGGSADLILSGGINLSAKGALTLNAGAHGDLITEGGGDMLRSAAVHASSGGKATLTGQAATSLSGGSVTLSAGDDISITGASNVASWASVGALANGVATLAATAGTKIAATGAFTATAGSDLTINANGLDRSGRAAIDTKVIAIGGNAQATLTASGTVQITAASVALKATAGSLHISAGGAGGRGGLASDASVFAYTRKDKASLTADQSVDITATGAISLIAGKLITLAGGSSVGRVAHAQAGLPASLSGSAGAPPPGVQATATLSATADVNLTAGGALTAKAGASMEFSNLLGAAIGATAFAKGNKDTATLSADDSINITASAITIAAATGFKIAGHDEVGSAAAAIGVSSGQASLSAVSTVDLDTKGNISLTVNDGGIFIFGGDQGILFNAALARASDGGVAKATVDSGISLKAGGNLSLAATGGDLSVGAGSDVYGRVDALFGSASVAVDASVHLSAAGNATLTAKAAKSTGGSLVGGDLLFAGGGRAGILADLAESSGSGVVHGTLADGANLTAGGNVTLTVSKDLKVEAGAGATMAVGGFTLNFPSHSISFGDVWRGGSADITGDMSAVVTAGKNLTLTAGGDLTVNALRKNPSSGSGFKDIVSVHGGSSDAVANVSFTGNATLNAGADIVLTVGGSAAVIGGLLNDVHADHTQGNVTLSGSANAALNAGLDVVSNIKGNLTVSAADFGTSAVETLIDAQGNSGNALVTGHADAAINAVRNISAALGGNLTMNGGKSVDVLALGSAAGSQQANGTADASLVAGGTVTVNAVGGLNVEGGRRGAASAIGIATHSGSITPGGVHSAGRIADLQADAKIIGTGGVTLTFGGSGSITAGGGMTANVAIAGSHVAATAMVDVSTSISGKNISLTVGKNLLVQAGGFDSVTALDPGHISAVTGSHNSANATMTADASLTAPGNITIKVGKGTVGSASFRGGNSAHERLAVASLPPPSHGTAPESSGNRLFGTIHADLGVTAGGNIALTVAGNLTVAGGQRPGGSGNVYAGSPAVPASSGMANRDVITSTLTAKAAFTAGGAIAITLKGGNAVLAGGIQAASYARVLAYGTGSNSVMATLDVDNSLSLTAGGALTLAGAGNVAISTQLVAAGIPEAFAFGADTRATVTADGSVTITGKTVNINKGVHVTTNSAGVFAASGPSTGTFHGLALGKTRTYLNGTITVTATGGTAPVLSAPIVETLGMAHSLLEVAPLTTGVSFGTKTASGMPVTDIQDSVGLPVALDTSSSNLTTDTTDQPLGALQASSIVTSVVSLVAGEASSTSDLGSSTLYTPGFDDNSYRSTFSGACTALVVSGGHSRCAAGSK